MEAAGTPAPAFQPGSELHTAQTPRLPETGLGGTRGVAPAYTRNLPIYLSFLQLRKVYGTHFLFLTLYL